jgi:hypothetical protein
MNRIINLTVGLIFGSIFAIALILVLMIFFAVLIPFFFYLSVREVLKYLTKR